MNSKNRGQSMVEFALIAPVLCLLVFGGFDIGIAMWRKMIMNQAVISGVRVAAMQSTANDADVQTTIEGIASFITNADITINRSYTILSSSDSVKVTVTYTNSYLTQFLPGGSLLMTASMSMLKESS